LFPFEDVDGEEEEEPDEEDFLLSFLLVVSFFLKFEGEFFGGKFFFRFC